MKETEAIGLIADLFVIGYAVFIFLLALIFVGAELLKKREEKQSENQSKKSEPQSACSEEGGQENVIREVIHRLNDELKYGSKDEALSDTLEMCVTRLQSVLPGEEAR